MHIWQDDVSTSNDDASTSHDDASTSHDHIEVSLAAEHGRPEPILQVADLSAGYGGPPIVSGLNLTVGKGEIVTIVGPNGAGKSTLVKTIIGELRASRGVVTLAGKPVTAVPTELLVRRGIGYVPQRNDVFGMLTVRENLEVGGYLLAKREVGRRIQETLSYFPRLEELAARRVLVSKMSGGERKMLALARALMMRPEVLILDEPTAGLAVQVAKTVLHEQVPALAERGVSILLIEQRAADALEISNWGYVLVSGMVRISASASEILGRKDIGEIFLGKFSTDTR